MQGLILVMQAVFPLSHVLNSQNFSDLKVFNSVAFSSCTMLCNHPI
jgi:hypothetical protein